MPETSGFRTINDDLFLTNNAFKNATPGYCETHKGVITSFCIVLSSFKTAGSTAVKTTVACLEIPWGLVSLNPGEDSWWKQEPKKHRNRTLFRRQRSFSHHSNLNSKQSSLGEFALSTKSAERSWEVTP